jgi:hypothetical protein
MGWKRKGLVAALGGLGLLAAGLAAAPVAQARVFFGVGFGVPVYAPRVYYAPPPVYYGPPVMYERRVYYRRWVRHVHHVVHRSCPCACN